MRSVSAQTSPQGHTASINGMEMYYEIHGEGPPLVLLHHFTGTGRKTSEVLKELSRNEIESKQRPNPADKSVVETSAVCSAPI